MCSCMIKENYRKEKELEKELKKKAQQDYELKEIV